MAPKRKEKAVEEEKEPKGEESKDEDVEGKAAGEEEAVAVAEATPVELEGPKELEQDAPTEKGGKIKAEDVAFHAEDTTLNVIPIADSSLLMTLTEGGLQYLLAGARASVGVKSGRYMFEAMIAEMKNLSEPQGARTQLPKPKQLLRVGFSTAASSPLLGDGSDNLYFDSEGFIVHGRNRRKIAQKIAPGTVAAIVLNLDRSSPNADTVSLFCDGVRASEPQPLPDQLKGETLYPAVTYRNVTVHANLGPKPLKPLPFKCNMVKVALKKDCEVKKKALPIDGKYEAIFPVCLPDEGTFDWVDQFLAENKSFTELSERAIAAWAAKSGIHETSGQNQHNHGHPCMGDHGVSRILASVAPTLDRNFVVADVKANLLGNERKNGISRFAGSAFKRVAHVMMGEPTGKFKIWVLDAILQRKKVAAEAEARKKKADVTRRRAEEERRKKLLEARKPKDANKECDDGTKELDTAEKESELKEEQEEEITVELTEEEKKQRFLPRASPDVSEYDLARYFGSFGIPGGDEGFDEIKFDWAAEEKCKDHLAQWVLGKKLTQRVENLQPGEWFKGQWSTWTKLVAEWKRKQAEFKDPAKRKAAALRKRNEETKAKDNSGDALDGDGHEAKGEAALMEVDAEELDVFAVDDVTDIGNGEPLFARFASEDWALLSLRFELHLLVHAFRRDLNDPECASFIDAHLAFYYNKYYKKQLVAKSFACVTISELVQLVKDTVEISLEDKMLVSKQADDTPMGNFAKLTEDHRRDRQRRLDAGDETAEVRFSTAAVAPYQPQRPLTPGIVVRRPPFAGGVVSPPPAKKPRTSFYAAPRTYDGSGNNYGGQKC